LGERFQISRLLKIFNSSQSKCRNQKDKISDRCSRKTTFKEGLHSVIFLRKTLTARSKNLGHEHKYRTQEEGSGVQHDVNCLKISWQK
jgi:hypothetical protein